MLWHDDGTKTWPEFVAFLIAAPFIIMAYIIAIPVIWALSGFRR